MAKTQVRVVAAVIRSDGRYLICQRPLSKRHGGLWEFPGGKAEENESDSDAIKRELGEELGVVTTLVGEPELTIRDPNSPYLIVFLPVVIDGWPLAREHLRIRWATITELFGTPLAPADCIFARHLRRLE